MKAEARKRAQEQQLHAAKVQRLQAQLREAQQRERELEEEVQTLRDCNNSLAKEVEDERAWRTQVWLWLAASEDGEAAGARAGRQRCCFRLHEALFAVEARNPK